MGPAAVQLAGDTAQRRGVGGVVGVEQIERHPPDTCLPRSQPQIVAGILDLDPYPLPGLIPHRRYRKLPGVVVRVERRLPAMRIERLPEIPLLVQQTDADDRDSQVARCLQLITCDVAESAR